MDEVKTKKNKQKKSRSFLSSFCSFFGTMILIIVIISALPLAVPRIFGLNIFNVISPSMDPAIPMGSIVYTKKVDPRILESGDVIAFSRNEDVVMHRVVVNTKERGELTTKGDANEMVDIDPVQYRKVIGIVKLHIPYLGAIAGFYASSRGKIYAICLIVSGALFSLVGSLTQKRGDE